MSFEISGLEKAVIQQISKTLELKFKEVKIIYQRTGRDMNFTISLCKFAAKNSRDLLKMDIERLPKHSDQ